MSERFERFVDGLKIPAFILSWVFLLVMTIWLRLELGDCRRACKPCEVVIQEAPYMAPYTPQWKPGMEN